MEHTKQIYTLTKNPKIISKRDNKKTVNVSGKMFIEELVDLCNKNVLDLGLKVKCRHSKQIVYIFNANKKSKMYNAHSVSSVIIKVNYKNIDINIDNIESFDNLINNVKDINTYLAFKDVVELGNVHGFVATGISLGTYSSPKLSIGLSTQINKQSMPSDMMYNPSNINSFIVFDDDVDVSYIPSPEKQYVYKN